MRPIKININIDNDFKLEDLHSKDYEYPKDYIEGTYDKIEETPLEKELKKKDKK